MGCRHIIFVAKANDIYSSFLFFNILRIVLALGMNATVSYELASQVYINESMLQALNKVWRLFRGMLLLYVARVTSSHISRGTMVSFVCFG